MVLTNITLVSVVMAVGTVVEMAVGKANSKGNRYGNIYGSGNGIRQRKSINYKKK